MLQAVIFDMDGVIIDSEPFHLQVNRQLYKELGIKFSEKEYANYIGISNEEMWADIKKRHNLPQSVQSLKEMQIKRDLECLQEASEEPIPGVKELLGELAEKEIPIALASSSSLRLIYAVLDSLNVKKYFSVVVSGENMKRGKPAPEIFLHTADLLGADPVYCLVIEDSRNGVTAAKAAGMKCIGFKNPNSGKQDLSAADYITDSMKDLNVKLLQDFFNFTG